MVIAKLHLTEDGFKEILNIRASMNLRLTDQIKFVFFNLKPAKKPIVENFSIQNPNWLSGFTSGGYGCFNVIVVKSSHTKLGYRVCLRFEIAQHNWDIELLKSFITCLGCGRVEEDLKASASYFVVTKFSDVPQLLAPPAWEEKVIPHFDKYSIIGVKSLDYLSFRQIAMLMKDNHHLTEEGLEKIKQIKSNMNKI